MPVNCLSIPAPNCCCCCCCCRCRCRRRRSRLDQTALLGATWPLAVELELKFTRKFLLAASRVARTRRKLRVAAGPATATQSPVWFWSGRRVTDAPSNTPACNYNCNLCALSFDGPLQRASKSEGAADGPGAKKTAAAATAAAHAMTRCLRITHAKGQRW